MILLKDFNFATYHVVVSSSNKMRFTTSVTFEELEAETWRIRNAIKKAHGDAVELPVKDRSVKLSEMGIRHWAQCINTLLLAPQYGIITFGFIMLSSEKMTVAGVEITPICALMSGNRMRKGLAARIEDPTIAGETMIALFGGTYLDDIEQCQSDKDSGEELPSLRILTPLSFHGQSMALADGDIYDRDYCNVLPVILNVDTNMHNRVIVNPKEAICSYIMGGE